MNNDIRISCSFPEHYKTKKLIAIAGNAAPFSLISLWVYAARNKPDGFLDNMDNFDIEIASNWTGQSNLFFDALVKCKFLEVADEGYYLHDWQFHQPYASSAEERSDKARFAILARHNRDMHIKLKEQGVNGLSVAEYKEYTKRIRPENESNTKTYKNLTPSPLPYPVPLPAPEPLPFPKENNTPAFSDKKAFADLPFSDESDCENEKALPLQEEPKAEEKIKEKEQAPTKSAYSSDFESFWSKYPSKTGKGVAAKAFKKALKTASVDEIMNGLANYCNSRKVAEGIICNPSTWLNQERWNDVCEPVEMEVEPSQALTDEQLEYIYAMEERIAAEEAEKAKQQKE